METKDEKENTEEKDHSYDEVKKLVLKILRKNKHGFYMREIMRQMPKDISKSYIHSCIPFLLNDGYIVPVEAYRINTRRNRQSPYIGFAENYLNTLPDEEDTGEQ